MVASESRVMTAEGRQEFEFLIALPRDLGNLLVRYRASRLRSVQFLKEAHGGHHRRETGALQLVQDEGLEERLRSDFQAYFAGKEVKFDYPLHLDEFTPFQRAVWAAMRTIPYGETRSYQWIARRIGKPRATRAVGNACGRNPLLIVQPCHRVVGSNGELGGFSGGLDLKKALLKLEGVDLSKFG
jgi:methylated-DNA-[protein]-cysteine S-methyltransferase